MIKHWLITGDTHGLVKERLRLAQQKCPFLPAETAIIILGDVGLNFYLNKTDFKNKIFLNKHFEYTIYCVRGNHEERPENLPGIIKWYDPDVSGWVYIEPEFPKIRYFIDGYEYLINGHSTLVICGAYSVDKEYRLSKMKTGAKWTGWFKDEQLTREEISKISFRVIGRTFDLILTHTCPTSWEPTDKFIASIDQETVDRTMELWLEGLKDFVYWKKWYFGHYHVDRKMYDDDNREYTAMFTDIKELGA